MEIKVLELSDSQRELDVTLLYEEIQSDINSEVQKQSKKIQLPGFRKGKVPLNIIKKMYGDALEHEASEKVANKYFWKSIDEKKLSPIGQPVIFDLQYNPGGRLSFKVKFEVLPVLNVTNYKGLHIEVPDFKVSDKEIDAELQHIVRSNRTFEDAEVIGGRDFVIQTDLQRVSSSGEPLDAAKSENISIDLSDENVNLEIVENVKHKKVGDVFEFSFSDTSQVKEKDNADSEEAAQTVPEVFSYKGKIKEIKKAVSPELTEDFIKKVTKEKISNETDFREEIKKEIQIYYDSKTNEIGENKLIELIVKQNDFNPPVSLVESMLEGMVQNELKKAKDSGYANVDKTILRKNLSGAAEFTVKWYLIKKEIEKNEKLSVEDNELSELAAKDSERTGIPIDKLLNYYKTSNYEDKLLDKKLLDFLKSNNEVIKVPPEKFQKIEKKD